MAKRNRILACMAASMFLSVPVQANETSEFERAPTDVGMIGFDAARVDFGPVAQGEFLEHIFLFKNNGLGVFQIEKAYSNVSGVSVLTSLKPFETDEIGEIRVRVDTSQMEGEQYIRVKVDSDAYNAPSTLYLLANVQAEAEVSEDADDQD